MFYIYLCSKLFC